MICPNCDQEMFKFDRFIDKGEREHYICQNENCIFFGMQRTKVLKG